MLPPTVFINKYFMCKYFILENLETNDILPDLQNYVDNFDEWIKYGYGRFAIYIGFPIRDKIIPLAKKFKNPRDIIKKIEINYIPAKGIVIPHTDHERNVTINIPIKGDFYNSTLDFYEKTNEGKIANVHEADGSSSETSARSYIHCPLVEQISYQKPVCFNTQDVHGVTNQTTEDRYIITVTIKDEFTVDTVMDMYNKGELLA